MGVIHPANKTTFLLCVVPLSEIEPQHVVKTENGEELPTFKFFREPRTIDELLPYKDGVVVSMDNGTLLLMNFRDSLRCSTQVEYFKYFQLHFHLGDKTCTTCQIFGDSEDKILETVVFFASLKVSAGQRMSCIKIGYSREFIFDTTSHENQLAAILDAASTKKITVWNCSLNHVISTVIATRPYPIDLFLQYSPIDHDAFFENLQRRTTLFGSLKLDRHTVKRDDRMLRQLFDHLHLFEHLDLPCVPSDLLLKLLAAPLKSICFTVDTEDEEIDLGEADIVPKDIVVSSIMTNTTFQTRFMLSFFNRLAQLGHLERLAVNASIFYRGPPTNTDVGNALIRAVRGSKKLKRLEFHENPRVWDNCLKDLFRVLESHDTPCTVHLHDYPGALDPEYSWLKQLLRRNRKIEVDSIWDSILKMEDTCALNRVFCGSQRLTQEPPFIRTSLVGTALTHSVAANRLRRIGILLTDQVDVICDLLQDVVTTDGADDTVTIEANQVSLAVAPSIAPKAEAERDRGVKRRRMTGP